MKGVGHAVQTVAASTLSGAQQAATSLEGLVWQSGNRYERFHRTACRFHNASQHGRLSGHWTLQQRTRYQYRVWCGTDMVVEFYLTEPRERGGRR